MTNPPSKDPDRDTYGANVEAVHRYAHDAMACSCELYIVAADARYAQQVAGAVFDEIDRLEQLLSHFIPHSDIAQLNALNPGHSIRVSPETVECLQLAAQLHKNTDGAFDVTYRNRSQTPQTTSDVTCAPLVFDPCCHEVGIQTAGVTIDLGGLGKGYALDCAAAVLRDWEVKAALLHAGQSTALAVGHPPEASAWRVALRGGDIADKALYEVELSDRALSGSGQVLHGRHIIDPRTGQPVDEAREAWALAPTAAEADALSTAFMVMTPSEIDRCCRLRDRVSAILRTKSPREAKLSFLGDRTNLLNAEGESA